MNSSQDGITTTTSSDSTVASASGTIATTSGQGNSGKRSTMTVEKKLPSSSREQRNMAEKQRRDKLNNYVSEIADIVPLGSGVGPNKRIDKTSVLRLAANYIRMHKVLNDESEPSFHQSFIGKDITNSLSEAVGGFLLVVTSSGKVLYITDAVDQFFGYTQVDLLGHSIYNVIHPDDHSIFQQQLKPKDNCRRSFYCRMLEKGLCRNDPGRYEIILVVGQLKPLPEPTEPSFSASTPDAPSPGESALMSDCDEDSDSEMKSLKASNKLGSHMLVSFVRVVKDRPITELTLVESTKEEYITRHGMDGKILYTDHRISFVTGLMPSEVVGTSAFNYMHQDDMLWSMVAQKLMFTSTQGQGNVSYRLRRRDGEHVTLRSRGFLEVNKQTGQVESFVCINTVLSAQDAVDEIKNQRRKLLPVIACNETEDHLGSISSALPKEIMKLLENVMNPETVRKMIDSMKSFDSTIAVVSDETNEVIPMDSSSSYDSHLATQVDFSEGGSSFQTMPKKISKDISFHEASPQTLSQDKWPSASVKRSYENDFSAVTNKKIGSFTRTAPPSASPVSEKFVRNFNGTCQEYSGSIHISSTCSSGDALQQKISKEYKAEPASPHGYWQSGNTMPMVGQGQFKESCKVLETDNPIINQNVTPSTNYSHKMATSVSSLSINNQMKTGILFSCESSAFIACNEKRTDITPLNSQSSLYSPGSASQYSHEFSPSFNSSPSIVTHKNSTNCPSTSLSSNSNQSPYKNSTPKSFSYDSTMKLSPFAQDCDPSVSRNSSSNLMSQCSYQISVPSPSGMSATMLQGNRQLSPLGSQSSPATPYQQSPTQHPYCGPQVQSFAAPHQTVPPDTSYLCSDISRQFPREYNPQETSTAQEFGNLAVPVTAQDLNFGEFRTSGEPSVPGPFIPELSLSKESGSVFSNGHFQHHSSHSHQEGKS